MKTIGDSEEGLYKGGWTHFSLIAGGVIVGVFLFIGGLHFIKKGFLSSGGEVAGVEFEQAFDEEMAEGGESDVIWVPSSVYWMPATLAEITDGKAKRKEIFSSIENVRGQVDVVASVEAIEANKSEVVLVPKAKEVVVSIIEDLLPKKEVKLEDKILNFLGELEISLVKVDGKNSRVIMNKNFFKINSRVHEGYNLSLTEVTDTEIIFSDESGTRYKKSLTEGKVEKAG